jgi:hypothetical protein
MDLIVSPFTSVMMITYPSMLIVLVRMLLVSLCICEYLIVTSHGGRVDG